ADVAGHDDAVARAGGPAVQADAVRAGRRVEPAARLPGRELRDLRAIRGPYPRLAPARSRQHDAILPTPGHSSLMDAAQVFTVGQQALYTLLTVAAPVLVVVLVV